MCKPLLASINSPRLCGHSVVLCVVATRVWFIRCYHTTKKNLGGPGSSRGMLERIRAGLTEHTGNIISRWLRVRLIQLLVVRV